MAKKQSEKNSIENLTFEQAIETLSGIVRQIEAGQVPLQESLQQYEQGMKLIQHCRKILLNAEKRIELIHEKQQSAKPEELTDEESDRDANDQETDNTEDEGLF